MSISRLNGVLRNSEYNLIGTKYKHIALYIERRVVTFCADELGFLK